jgi:spermidine/putrescine transport system substrate-binding protein
MRGRFLLAVFLLTLVVLTSVTGNGQDRTLILYIWSDYIDPKIIKDFEKRFQVRVITSLYESDDDMFAKLQLNGTKQYDLVVPSTSIGKRMVLSGLVRKLERGKLPNLKNLAANFRVLPGGLSDYLVPYQWGTMGVAYRTDRVPKLERSWGVFFDPAKQAGPFVMLDVPHETIGAALRYFGKSLNSTNPSDLKAVLAPLESATRRSLGFVGGVEAGSRLLSGSVSYAMAYGGNIVKLSAENNNLGYFIPKEGSELFLDTIAITKNAPHSDLAHAFINYLLDPRVGARLSNYNRYATPNAAAKPFIRPEDLRNPIMYPLEQDMKRLELIEDLGDAARLYDAVWTRLKTR